MIFSLPFSWSGLQFCIDLRVFVLGSPTTAEAEKDNVWNDIGRFHSAVLYDKNGDRSETTASPTRHLGACTIAKHGGKF